VAISLPSLNFGGPKMGSLYEFYWLSDQIA